MFEFPDDITQVRIKKEDKKLDYLLVISVYSDI